jgi:hypothetical protein
MILDLQTKLPFGVEIEVNSFDLKSRPDSKKLPEGSYDIAFLVNDLLKERVFVSKWCNNHDNNYWAIKPDSSCGMELCSPVLKGYAGIDKVSQVVAALKKDGRISSDSRCSFHVHFDVSSLSEIQLLSIISWWIKLEGFFMDTVPASRKNNQYCRLIAQSNIVNNVYDFYDLNYFLEKLGSNKYYSLNTFHYYNKRRKTIEFRIMDSFCCLDPQTAKGWISTLHHFIERAISTGLPPNYEQDNPLSGFCWLDPIDSFAFLDFHLNQHLTDRLLFVRNWLVKRLTDCGNDYLKFGIFSSPLRKLSYREICKLEKIFR